MGNQIKVGIPVVGGKSWFGGVATVEHLIKALALLDAAERPQTYLVVYEQSVPAFAEYARFAGGFDGVLCVGKNRDLFLKEMAPPLQFLETMEELFAFIDVLFPVSMGVIPGQCAVSWIDDFQHRRLPQFFPQQVIQQRERTLGKIAEQARLVAVHTRDVKNDFHTYYPDSKAIVKVLNYRVRQEPEWVAGDPVEIQKKYQLPDSFLMCSNQFWIHKNHKGLFEAIAVLKKQGRTLHLVCTGHTGDFRTPQYFDKLMEYVTQLGIDKQIHVLGLIPRFDQIQLLRRALFVVQPSLFEGLGFIVQECAALGKHIVLSDLEAHKEQASEYTHFYDQEDPVALARQIDFLLHAGFQPGPHRREEERARLVAEKNVRSFGKQFGELAQFSIDLFAKNRPKSEDQKTIPSRDTWTALLKRFNDEQTEKKKTDVAGAALAADEFLLTYARRIQPEQSMGILPRLVEQWMLHRRLPHRFGAISPAEMERLLTISSLLRQQMRYLLLHHDLSAFGFWSERQQQQWVSLWRLLFLNFFSPLALKAGKAPAQHEGRKLRDYLVRSLYDLTPENEEGMDVPSLLAEAAPGFLKAIFCSWLMGTPYFGVVEQDRRRACRYAAELCKELTRPAPWLSFGAFATIMEEMMASFWRISYAGGDCSRELAALGDFITFHMNRLLPQEKLRIVQKDSHAEPLNIGYISRNFCKQAVSFYMVNRVIHHDSSRFVLHTFVGGDRDDELTEVFKKHSDKFTRQAQLTDLAGIIRQIKESKLDILVFADLGMDPFTLMLAGLRLAPLQCVLVGHGVTSGMPNIDYYISGDFEPDDAERFYREKLVRLPKLGAAQYPPIIPEKFPTRQDYKIPEDAVVYVSCANGIKIHPDQDRLFLEILRQVPKAWLVLKPFQTPDAMDMRFLERFFAPARAAGLADRILIVPPFKQAKDVLGLLAFADIQLDTYPYGGWTTNMEAVYMGLPIVTQEGAMARSRWGPSMLRALGVSEGIAGNETEYVDWAVKLGTDRDLRERVRSVIKEKAVPTFFDGAAAQAAYEEILVKCYQEKCEEQQR